MITALTTKIAITGKPVSYGYVSRHQLRHTPRSVGAWLASDGVFGIAITGKPVSYGYVSRRQLRHTPRSVGAWLASDGVREIGD